MPGLGTSFGRGGATTSLMDLRFADAVLIMGSNMAECHPVGFRFVMQAKLAGAKVLHVDPRFTRTSAMADTYAPLRAGSDIVFLGGLIRYVLEHEKYFKEYVLAYTNASTLINEDYKDTEDLAGVFSGFDAEKHRYDARSWRYDSEKRKEPTNHPKPEQDDSQSFSARAGQLTAPPRTDPTLQDPRCVFQILRRHYARYTPEMVERVCGTPAATFLKVAETLVDASGPDRSAAVCYAVGWTQHTTGVQTIRASTILQLLLGNIGRVGGGIMALRGHASIQGSTDIPTLYNLLPGYLNCPSALKSHETLKGYIDAEISPTSYWVNFSKFMVSLLKAWFGDAARCRQRVRLPLAPQDRRRPLPHADVRLDGRGPHQGLLRDGPEPGRRRPERRLSGRALAKLDWLVVRDLYETETATFWKDAPEITSGEVKPEDIATEVFLLPAAAGAEMDGTYTNTQRLLQWHERAADPPGDARSDIWFTYHLGVRLKALYAASDLPRDRPIKALTWDYLDPAENADWRVKDEPSASLILKEMNGFTVADRKLVKGFAELKDDGSTACGAWIYSGVYAPTPQDPLGQNRAANRQGDDWVSLGWGFAWPANRRIMYNRASADPEGDPWPKEARLARKHGNGAQGICLLGRRPQAWEGLDIPDFPINKPPTAKADPDGIGLEFHDGASPFIMKADGKGWLFAPSGLADGPLPTHYEPYESPVRNPALSRPAGQSRRQDLQGRGQPVCGGRVGRISLRALDLSPDRAPPERVDEPLAPLARALQPELFVEISPEHAGEVGLANLDRVAISTPRATIHAKALVTRRIRPFVIDGRTIHHVGMPWHWGYKGVVTGDVVNDLAALVGDPNVTIHEAKVFTCRVSKG